jgi:hypothetical protein
MMMQLVIGSQPVTVSLNRSNMKHKEYVKKIKMLSQLVDGGSTGTPKQLAKRLNVSERTARRLVDDLKEEDETIFYDRKFCTYRRNEFYVSTLKNPTTIK